MPNNPRYIYPLPTTVARRSDRTHKRMRLAPMPCRARVEGSLCGEVWETVVYKHGKVAGYRCYSHGHWHHYDATVMLATLSREWKRLQPRKRAKIRKILGKGARHGK